MGRLPFSSLAIPSPDTPGQAVSTLLCVLLMAAVFSGQGPCQAQEIIFPPDGQNLTVGDVPYFVLFGDVDLDGDPDLLSVNQFQGVSVRFGDGVGGFSKTGQDLNMGVEDASTAALEDLDLDGDLDLVVARSSGTACSVHLNDGQGTFATTGTEVEVGPDPWSVVLADVNMDGDVDLIASSFSSVRVFFGNGDGTFETLGQEIPVAGVVRSLVVADLDLDGDPDFVTANYAPLGPGTCSTRFNDGSGVFAATGQDVPVGGAVISVALGDVDLDGDLDLVSANFSDGTCSVRLNDGLGVFARDGQEVPTESLPFSVAVGDVNRDGSPDIVVANLFGSSCSVRLNDGTGVFATTGQEVPITPGQGTFTSLDFVTYVALEDVDLDGDLDLAAAFVRGLGTDFVAVRLNQVEVFRRGDSNGDGVVQLADLMFLLDYHLLDGAAPACKDAADVNDDDRLDIADPIYGISYLFGDGPLPPSPHIDCGGDPTADDLGCEEGGFCP